MQAVLNVALPVFGIVLCGHLAGQVKLQRATSSEALNTAGYGFAAAGIVMTTLLSVITLTAILGWFGEV